ncbi:MAG: penicillin-binding transpeptidase domain-containing protein [Victivallaceae bacterium]|nr:penicillin-binding transpeptidase domain-containing protein [Victivallaceae bacterium]
MAVSLDTPRARIAIIAAVLLGIFVLMGIKAFREQVNLGAKHEGAVIRQSVRRIRIPALRGKIFSADLELLAGNVVCYDVNFYPDEMRQPGPPSRTVNYALKIYAELQAALGRRGNLTDDEIRYLFYNRAGLPMTVFSDLSDRDISAVFDLQKRYSGIEVSPDSRRLYPQYDLACHLLGYAQRQDPAKADDRGDFFYYLPDLVGKVGLEKYCDAFPGLRGLCGDAGYELVRVDNFGFVREVIDRTSTPVNGNNVILTLDARAQRIAESLLRDQDGAIVLLDADTGAVIAMCSEPGYDLNLFSPGISSVRYRALATSPDSPLFNRAIYGSYLPGSIIKPLTLLAYLESGGDPEAEISCDGSTTVSGVRIRCESWRNGGHGPVNLYSAIEKSCNDYVIERAVALGLGPLAKMYASAGIGKKPGFELGGNSGLLPDENLARRLKKRAWSGADTAYVSIGQGMIEITPLQAALYAAAIANGGNLMRPYVVDKVIDDRGTVLRQTRPEVAGRLAASPENIDIIRQAMRRVVVSGTGRRAKTEVIDLYGKTGTAEVGIKPNLRNNSFFICFGSDGKRTYAMFIAVESGSGGGRDCAPLAKAFFEEYLNTQR